MQLGEMIGLRRNGLEEIREMQEERAVAAGLNRGAEADFERSMQELVSLAEACGIVTAAVITQRLAVPNSARYVGPGKVEEIREALAEQEAALVIFNEDLSPIQLRNLQRELGVPVLDRTNLILQIFEKRARTKEAKLQVEVAGLQYLLPRLTGMREALSRQGGSGGSAGGRGFANKGAGEKKRELDRRWIEHRISELKKELALIERERETRRKKRAGSGLPQAALVGYTNAGKSTLLNRLVELSAAEGTAEQKQVLEKDMLFATLDTTVRRISPGDNRDFLLSDTVGFIDKLPHHLVQAFRSTLAEARNADLLLVMADCSDPYYREQLQVTRKTLEELGAGDIPCLYLYNKADLVMAADELPQIKGDRIWLCAKQGTGLRELVDLIREKLFADFLDWELLLPYDRGDVVSRLQEEAVVKTVSYEPEGIRMQVHGSPADYARYAVYAV